MWGPGTSNMYRRSVMALAHQEPKDRAYFRAADSYFNRLCHAFGGCALIDVGICQPTECMTKTTSPNVKSVRNLKKVDWTTKRDWIKRVAS